MEALKFSGRVAVDARMIRSSGIGVALRRILDIWVKNPPGDGLVLYGDEAVLGELYQASAQVEIRPWKARLYSATAALLAPPLPSDVVVWYSPHYATCLRVSCPLVCHVQDVLHITHPSSAGTATFMRWYLSLLRGKAAFILTTTRHVKVQLQTLYHFAPERTLITGLGCGVVEGIEPAAALPAGVPSGPYFLAVGIFKKHKNWPLLMERFAALGEGIPPLVAIGIERHRAEFDALVAQYGVANRVYTVDVLDDASLAALYRGATALLYPSGAEGFGLPVAEALASGTPLVCAERSPMKEIAGPAAWYFDPDRPESFDAAVLGLLENEAERNRRISVGREVSAGYRWEATARAVEEALYRAATGKLPAVAASK